MVIQEERNFLNCVNSIRKKSEMTIHTSATITNDIFLYSANEYPCMSNALHLCKLKIANYVYNCLYDKYLTYKCISTGAVRIEVYRQDDAAFSSYIIDDELNTFIEKILKNRNEKLFVDRVDSIVNKILSQSEIKVCHQSIKTPYDLNSIVHPDEQLMLKWKKIWNEELGIPKDVGVNDAIFIDAADEAWYQYFRLWIHRAPILHQDFLPVFFQALDKPGVSIYVALVYTVIRLRNAISYKPKSFYRVMRIVEKANILAPKVLKELIENKKKGAKYSSFLAYSAMDTNFTWEFDNTIYSYPKCTTIYKDFSLLFSEEYIKTLSEPLHKTLETAG